MHGIDGGQDVLAQHHIGAGDVFAQLRHGGGADDVGGHKGALVDESQRKGGEREAGGFGDGGDSGGEKDALYNQAVEIVLKNRKASISLVQRHLKIGYNRAARLVEDMEKAGLVSSMSSSGQRDILVPARAE